MQAGCLYGQCCRLQVPFWNSKQYLVLNLIAPPSTSAELASTLKSAVTQAEGLELSRARSGRFLRSCSDPVSRDPSFDSLCSSHLPPGMQSNTSCLALLATQHPNAFRTIPCLFSGHLTLWEKAWARPCQRSVCVSGCLECLGSLRKSWASILYSW